MTINTENNITITVGTSAAELNYIIAKAPPQTTITLAEGKHIFTESVNITRSDVTLRGETETSTIVSFDFARHAIEDGIQVLAGQKKLIGNTTEDIAVGQKELVMTDASRVKAGDMLFISQPNDKEIMRDPLYKNVSDEDFKAKPFKETMAEVDRVEGNTVYLKHAIPHEMDARFTEVYKIKVLDNVQISDMTVTYENLGPTPDTYNFANTLPDYVKTAAVYLDGTRDAVLKNISILDAASLGFDIRSTIELKADNLLVDGAYNKGKEANGYAIQLYESFYNDFTNLELFNTRHGFLFSAWHSEAYNTIHIADTNRDINFHGGMDKFNVITVDKSVVEYFPQLNKGPEYGAWALVSPGGIKQPFTDIYGDNVVRFNYVDAGERDDHFFGTDDANKLSGNKGHDNILGMGGDDTIQGGEGDDTLIGGDGNDDLNGGDGADIILGGDGADSIVGRVGDDKLAGGDGNDKLSGDSGDDRLFGGVGRDMLEGGSGNDVFLFTAIEESTRKQSQSDDMILDFIVGQDLLNISALDFTGLDTDGGKTEMGELRIAYSEASNRTYIRSDQTDFQIGLIGDYRTTLSDADFLF